MFRGLKVSKLRKYASWLLAIVMLLSVLAISGCGAKTENKEAANKEPAKTETKPGMGGSAIGFLFVGPKDDYGYNQAAYLGSVEVEKKFPDLKVLRAENVPETAEAERVMEQMIQNGAKIIFPTSYGHLDPALNVAKRHPDVLFMHQGGLKNAENLGTYFSNIWENIYVSGIAAGKMTKTNKLGYIVSFPIPQVLLNVNAFTLGARSVNPNATVYAVFTNSWADPAKQTEAANALIGKGVDVLTQHQDATKTIVEIAERQGIMSVGYHADASPLAQKGWITGSQWNWGPLYSDIVETILTGKWTESPYNGKYRAGTKDGCAVLSPFGSSVPDAVKELVQQRRQEILDGKLFPFEGPVKDQDGKERIPAGKRPTIEELETMDYLVEGIVGTIPKS